MDLIALAADFIALATSSTKACNAALASLMPVWVPAASSGSSVTAKLAARMVGPSASAAKPAAASMRCGSSNSAAVFAKAAIAFVARAASLVTRQFGPAGRALH